MIDGEVVTNGAALAIVPKQTAMELHRHATDVATVCKEIVNKTAVLIQGRRYVRVEGWMSLANAWGLVASARDVERVDGGIRAIGELRNPSTGVIVATGEGFVGDDEKTWAARPEYARRAMAQTRAISRACRSALAFVVVMINEKLDVAERLSTTPAEEVPDGGFNDSAKPLPAPMGVAGLKQNLPPKVQERLQKLAEPPPHTDDDQPYDEEANGIAPMDAKCPPYGNNKGKMLSELSVKDLQFYEGGAIKSVADPSKAKYKDSNEAQLKLFRAWIAFKS